MRRAHDVVGPTDHRSLRHRVADRSGADGRRAGKSELVIAVVEGGRPRLAALRDALAPMQARTELGIIRQRTSRPINVNFFCHVPPQLDARREAAWRQRLAALLCRARHRSRKPIADRRRAPFDEALCRLIEEFRPEVVSFHFGLPDEQLLAAR